VCTTVDEVTVKPRLVNNTAVARALEQNYGGVQRDASIEGTFHLRLIVERDGRTSSIVVVRSSDALFNAPAINVVRAMRFNPAQVNGGRCASALSSRSPSGRISDGGGNRVQTADKREKRTAGARESAH
jgi:TonB family protein